MAKLTTRKASIVKVGDTVIITGFSRIGEDYFKKHYPQGVFGRVIEVRPRYSQNDGSRYMDKIVVRAYTRGGRSHYDTNNQYIKPYTVK